MFCILEPQSNTCRSILFILTAFLLPVDESNADSAGWPQWRGADQSGVADSGMRYPIEWSGTQSIKWKVDVPGQAGSTPVVDQGTVFVTAGFEGKNTLIAFDLETGKQRWQKSLGEDKGNKHRKGGGSNPSPVIAHTRQGKSVIIVYYRSGDLAGFDHDGNELWQWNLQKKFTEDTLWWDLGSSPALIDGDVVIAVVQSGPSYLIKINPENGEVIWNQSRDVPAPEEAAQTYSTPLAMNVQGRSVIAMLGADHLTIHDSQTGKMLGSLGGFNPTGDKYFRSIASPVAQGSMLVFPYSRGDTLTGIDIGKLLDGKKETSILWSRDDFGTDVPSPAVDDDIAYVVSDSKTQKGTVAAIELTSGKTVWSLNLPKTRDSYSSSPLVAGNHLYVVREDATTFVIGPLDSKKPSIMSENVLPDAEIYTVASPVPIDGSLLIRTRHQLYRLGE
jgi:outer membrane protein assembly factor BamB